MIIRKLAENETDFALTLAWDVFQKFEAPDYSKQGVEEFYKSIHDINWLKSLKIYGAFENDKLIGVIASRNNGSQIALFFVKGEYQGKGIGRRLFEKFVSECCSDVVTVNSSPFAIPIYHKLGFSDTDCEQIFSGIRFTPMECKLKK